VRWDRLYAFEQRKPRANAVRSFLSADGLNWAAEAGDRLLAGVKEGISDPFVIRWKDGWKMYFKSEDRSEGGPSPGLLPDGWRGPAPDQEQRPGRPDAAGEPVRRPESTPGPWDHDVLVYRVRSTGEVTKIATFERAGVPTLARMKDGRLIAAHQHFPEDQEAAFDKVAVRFSSNEGKTWTPPEVIGLEGLPEGMRFPFDPTLVALPDGRVRLYFTSVRGRRLEASTPAICSAISNDGVHYTFEPSIRFSVEGRIVIDCAVVLHQGIFHLYAPDNGPQSRPGERPTGVGGRPRIGIGYHATSRDGLSFTRVNDVRVEGQRRWLGNAQSDGKLITFFGIGEPGRGGAAGPGQQRGGLWVATSADGQSWQLDERPPLLLGADPGAVAARDGAWVVAATGPPRAGTPSERRGGGSSRAAPKP
jgi:hypothetical protein